MKPVALDGNWDRGRTLRSKEIKRGKYWLGEIDPPIKVPGAPVRKSRFAQDFEDQD